MSGREKIMEHIRKNSILCIVGGGALFILALGFGIYRAVNGIFSSFTILCFVSAPICLALMIAGIHDLAVPYKALIFRSKPDLLYMADEHFSTIIHQDEFLIVSERMISAVSDPTSTSYREEVFLIYLEKESVNLVPTNKSIIFETARRSFRIDVNNKSKETIDMIFQTASFYCPHAAIGHSKENLAYLENSRQIWRQKHQK